MVLLGPLIKKKLNSKRRPAITSIVSYDLGSCPFILAIALPCVYQDICYSDIIKWLIRCGLHNIYGFCTSPSSNSNSISCSHHTCFYVFNWVFIFLHFCTFCQVWNKHYPFEGQIFLLWIRKGEKQSKEIKFRFFNLWHVYDGWPHIKFPSSTQLFSKELKCSRSVPIKLDFKASYY